MVYSKVLFPPNFIAKAMFATSLTVSWSLVCSDGDEVLEQSWLPAAALSLGVLLLRNSDWVRELLDGLAAYHINHPLVRLFLRLKPFTRAPVGRLYTQASCPMCC